MPLPDSKLLDDLWLERIRRAKRMTPEERMRASLEMFEFACQTALDGIRTQYPHFDEVQAQEELDRRMRRIRRIEEQGIYVDLTGDELHPPGYTPKHIFRSDAS